MQQLSVSTLKCFARRHAGPWSMLDLTPRPRDLVVTKKGLLMTPSSRLRCVLVYTSHAVAFGVRNRWLASGLASQEFERHMQAGLFSSAAAPAGALTLLLASCPSHSTDTHVQSLHCNALPG
jgi:hypothetical protein